MVDLVAPVVVATVAAFLCSDEAKFITGYIMPVSGGSAMPRVTVHDLAAEAGVSLATVDRVLNARPGVRDKTIRAVNEAIAKLRAARQLWARAADGAPSYHHADGSRVTTAYVQALERLLDEGGARHFDRGQLRTVCGKRHLLVLDAPDCGLAAAALLVIEGRRGHLAHVDW